VNVLFESWGRGGKIDCKIHIKVPLLCYVWHERNFFSFLFFFGRVRKRKKGESGRVITHEFSYGFLNRISYFRIFVLQDSDDDDRLTYCWTTRASKVSVYVMIGLNFWVFKQSGVHVCPRNSPRILLPHGGDKQD